MEADEMATSTATLDRAVASRLASAVAAIDGVRSALVCDAAGTALAASGSTEPARDAALASFVALRAEALPVDGDLRGMGRQLAGSRLDHVLISGPGAIDRLICGVAGQTYIALAVASGRSAAILPAIAQVLRRHALTPNTATRR
ncbi:MAG: hypothetical protein FIB00_00535 [Chloroflexi bacterium]|jgi:hypothetical protein|nr:hypothetical protein [Dehalococcoidia bacterium]NJD63726.1 hypothetical protein [Chloroflexota bacterium]PWB43808.1 MAG: hypothetical protein C3F10_10260 [Dehalococcoidia bacterium]